MNEQNLKPFTSENQPPNRGRKPNTLTALRKELDLSKDDVTAIFLNLIADKTEAELVELAGDEELPLFLRTYIGSPLKDLKKGDISTVREMLNYVFGTNTQKVQVSSPVGIEI